MKDLFTKPKMAPVEPSVVHTLDHGVLTVDQVRAKRAKAETNRIKHQLRKAKQSEGGR